MRNHLCVALFGSTVLFVGIACGGGNGVSVEAEPAAVEPPAVEPAAVEPASGGGDSILTAGVMWGSHLCTKKMGDNCVDPTTSFAPDTPLIYFVHQTKDLPKLGQTYNIRWVALDVGAAAPPNTLVAELNEVVSDGLMLKVATHYTISSEISKPTLDWPPGSYAVVVALDGTPVTEAPFTIE